MEFRRVIHFLFHRQGREDRLQFLIRHYCGGGGTFSRLSFGWNTLNDTMDEEVYGFDACGRDLIARLRVVVIFFFRIYFVVGFSASLVASIELGIQPINDLQVRCSAACILRRW